MIQVKFNSNKLSAIILFMCMCVQISAYEWESLIIIKFSDQPVIVGLNSDRESQKVCLKCLRRTTSLWSRAKVDGWVDLTRSISISATSSCLGLVRKGVKIPVSTIFLILYFQFFFFMSSVCIHFRLHLTTSWSFGRMDKHSSLCFRQWFM